MPTTLKANLLNTEVFSQAVLSRLGDALKLAGLVYQESFEGEQAGTINVPRYEYIGDASVIAENTAIPIDLLTSSMVSLPLVKVAKALELSDESVKSGYGDPIGEAEAQIAKSIANGVENLMFASMGDATLTYTNATADITGDTVLNASLLFGEDLDEEKTLVVNSANIASIRRDANYVDGKIFDTNIVVSDRVPAGRCYLMKQGAIAMYSGKNLQVETDRDIVMKTTVITADQMVAVHLRDASKIVEIVLAGA